MIDFCQSGQRNVLLIVSIVLLLTGALFTIHSSTQSETAAAFKHSTAISDATNASAIAQSHAVAAPAVVVMSNKERQLPIIERNRARVLASRAIGYEDSFRSSKFFWDNWFPEWSCETLERIGVAGDGGKFVCDLNRLTQLAVTNNSKCVMYSLGSENKVDFEVQFHGLAPACEIHVFDPTVQFPLPQLTDISTYHHWAISIPSANTAGSSSNHLAIADSSSSTSAGRGAAAVRAAASSSGLRDARTGQLAEEHTVTEIMHLLGHDQVQFMKMDVEGSEWAMLQSMLANADTELYLPDGRPRILTWMIEFHAWQAGARGFTFPDPMIAVIEGLLKHYYIYAVEANPHSTECHELAFIHKTVV